MNSYTRFLDYYNENDVRTKAVIGINEINAKKEVLWKKLSLLEAMNVVCDIKEASIKSIDNGCGLFPRLKEEAIKDINISNRTINKLYKIYTKI